MLELKEVFIFLLIYTGIVGGVLMNTLQYREATGRVSKGGQRPKTQ